MLVSKRNALEEYTETEMQKQKPLMKAAWKPYVLDKLVEPHYRCLTVENLSAIQYTRDSQNFGNLPHGIIKGPYDIDCKLDKCALVWTSERVRYLIW